MHERVSQPRTGGWWFPHALLATHPHRSIHSYHHQVLAGERPAYLAAGAEDPAAVAAGFTSTATADVLGAVGGVGADADAAVTTTTEGSERTAGEFCHELGMGWVQSWDPHYDHPYYYHSESGVSQWTLPDELAGGGDGGGEGGGAGGTIGDGAEAGAEAGAGTYAAAETALALGPAEADDDPGASAQAIGSATGAATAAAKHAHFVVDEDSEDERHRADGGMSASAGSKGREPSRKLFDEDSMDGEAEAGGDGAEAGEAAGEEGESAAYEEGEEDLRRLEKQLVFQAASFRLDEQEAAAARAVVGMGAGVGTGAGAGAGAGPNVGVFAGAETDKGVPPMTPFTKSASELQDAERQLQELMAHVAALRQKVHGKDEEDAGEDEPPLPPAIDPSMLPSVRALPAAPLSPDAVNPEWPGHFRDLGLGAGALNELEAAATGNLTSSEEEEEAEAEVDDYGLSSHERGPVAMDSGQFKRGPYEVAPPVGAVSQEVRNSERSGPNSLRLIHPPAPVAPPHHPPTPFRHL